MPNAIAPFTWCSTFHGFTAIPTSTAAVTRWTTGTPSDATEHSKISQT